MSDYANYISAKHKTDSAISYSHYTRFYAHISRVCTPAKTRGFSSSIRNKEELRKGGNSQVPHPSPKWREVSRQSRETAKGTEYPPTTSFIRPRNPRTVSYTHLDVYKRQIEIHRHLLLTDAPHSNKEGRKRPSPLHYAIKYCVLHQAIDER